MCDSTSNLLSVNTYRRYNQLNSLCAYVDLIIYKDYFPEVDYLYYVYRFPYFHLLDS